jgi:hypothetical protein
MFEKPKSPDLDLLGTYLYMFLAYHPLHSSYQNHNPIMDRSSCMRASHAFLFCMHICLARATFPTCMSALHVLLFLHACLPYTCFFSSKLGLHPIGPQH